MYDFLQQFFQEHSEYSANDFFVTGESFAGHYIPATTHKIWQNNKNLPTGAIRINLVGFAIGNGLTAPEIQYKYYPEMISSSNGHSPAIKNTSLVYDAMTAAVPVCIAAVEACQATFLACIPATDTCNLGLVEPYSLTGMNVYDMRIKCEHPPLCYDFSNVATYLKQASVQEILGVTGHHWSDCNKAVTLPFVLSGDELQHYQYMIPEQLDDGIRVLIYAGDQDYICNWLGNQAWTLDMNWTHKTDFNNAKPASYVVDSKPAGMLRKSNDFSFLQVFDAGHMVPMDQPVVALNMLNSFLSNTL